MVCSPPKEIRGHHNPTVIMPPKIAKTPGTAAPGAPSALTFDPTNPFIVQSDRSVLVEVDNPRYTEARDAIAPFAEMCAHTPSRQVC